MCARLEVRGNGLPIRLRKTKIRKEILVVVESSIETGIVMDIESIVWVSMVSVVPVVVYVTVIVIVIKNRSILVISSISLI